MELAQTQVRLEELQGELTDVLDADRQLLVARDDVESTRADAARAAVRTFALGGGWDIRSNPSLSAVQ
jgi:outer membrane protein TolC